MLKINPALNREHILQLMKEGLELELWGENEQRLIDTAYLPASLI